MRSSSWTIRELAEFYTVVARLLRDEEIRRARVLADFAIAMDTGAGGIVDEPLDDYIARERANLREGPLT